jgi:23S rRNA G2445 N2-methylase RlmL
MNKINIAALTEYGLEKTTAKEVKEFFDVKSEISNAYVVFTINNTKENLEKLFKFSVLAQSIKKIILLVDHFDYKNDKDLKEKIKLAVAKKEFGYWFEDKPKFYVRCLHRNKNIDPREYEPMFGEIILNKYKDLKVSFDNSDIKVVTFLDENKALFGIDMTRNDLSKREYKLSNSNKSIRGILAYHLIRAVDYKNGEILVDPSSKTAEVVIEAQLYLSKMNNYYEAVFQCKKLKLFKDLDLSEIQNKLKTKAKKNLKSLKKNVFAYSDLLKDVNYGKANAKVAGVLDIIEFSKVTLDWLDTKFDKEKVDKIVTILPSESKVTSFNMVKKIYSEFLYQVDYILKPTGKIGILMQKPEKLIELMNQKHKALKVQSSEEIIIGGLILYCVIITK